MAGTSATTMSITREKCMGHGRCYSVAPDLLSDDEEGFVAQAGEDFTVPEELVGQAEASVDACPEHAITVTG
ncbi:ferredoxin [Rhodococcus sp. NPDC060086]|uniref:ferredoxin n=1 Tax=Rhodococcus sp. NPDC060086 TaxID=3347055 RepID=UPI00364A7320